MNRVFEEQLDELEVELFDTGVLKTEEATNISTFVPPNLETRLGSSAVPQVLQNSGERDKRCHVLDRLGEAPARRTLHPRRSLVSVQ